MGVKTILIQDPDKQDEQIYHTGSYVLILLEGKSAKVVGELDPQSFGPMIMGALLKKFGGGG